VPAKREQEGAVAVELQQAASARSVGVAHRRAVPLDGHDFGERNEIGDISRLASEAAETACRPASVHEAE